MGMALTRKKPDSGAAEMPDNIGEVKVVVQ